MQTHPFHDLKGEQHSQMLLLVDDTGHVIGTETREVCHRGKGKTHLAFMAFVKTPQGVVFTKRNEKKTLFGGYWDASVVSHVLEGETPVSAANRRGKEELGVDVTFRDIGAFLYQAQERDHAENEYCHILVGSTSSPVVHNPVEMSEICYIPHTDLIQRGRAMHPLAPWLRIALDQISEASLI